MSNAQPCDVLVAGGGAAGIAAAVAAADRGASVVLLERAGCFGGMATGALVGTVCGLYLRTDGGALGAAANLGFPMEFAERLARESGTRPIVVPPGLGILPFDAEAFSRLADGCVSARPSIRPSLHTTLCGASARDGQIEDVTAFVWDRLRSWQPKCVVDCTGEASGARAAGARMTDLSGTIAASVVFVIEGIAPASLEHAGRLSLLRTLARAAGDGALPPQVAHASFVPSREGEPKLTVKVVVPSADANVALDRVTALEFSGRRLAADVVSFLREHSPDCTAARLSRMAPQVGVRLGGCIVGEETLTESDVLRCRSREDGIARCAWPIEEWSEDGKPRIDALPVGSAYEIPMGSLQVRGFSNLLAAGRCISAEERALASARVIGTCLATGWAAGSMAARIASGGCASDALADVRSSFGMSKGTPP